MKYIDVNEPVPPRKLTLLNNRIDQVNAIATVVEKKDHIKKKRTWTILKKWLSEFSSGKCWYCEAFTERAAADVDHFRPKAGVTCNRTKLVNHDGYYWEAYLWTNYRYSCQRCNRAEEDENQLLCGKANEFSLLDESQRRHTPSCSGNEESLLLDPCIEEDTKLLAHLLNGAVEPSKARGTDEYDRAAYTKDVLGLNSFKVPEKKRKQWRPLQLLIDSTGDTEDPQVTDILKSFIADDAEYSSFFKAALSTNRDKGWVEALLR